MHGSNGVTREREGKVFSYASDKSGVNDGLISSRFPLLRKTDTGVH